MSVFTMISRDIRVVVLSVTFTTLIVGLAPCSQSYAAAVEDYIIIATGDPNNIDKAFSMSNSEIGAIGVNGSTSSPQGNPSFPSGTRGPSPGVTLDGDVAITHPGGLITFSNSDVHAMNNGPNFVGAQGVDSQNSYNGTTDNGSQISSNNRFNKSLAPSFSVLANNNGVQGNIALGGLITQLSSVSGTIGSFSSTHQEMITNAINNDRTDNFQNGINELIVFDIMTSGTDLRLDTANWIVQGDANDVVIYRVNDGAILSSQNGNFLLAGDIGENNVMFYVNADQGEGSFSFDNTEFFGYSFWDIDGADDNEAVWNNVRGCGQVVTNKVNFNNVSMAGCSFNTTAIPEPSSLALITLCGFVVCMRRRPSCRECAGSTEIGNRPSA